jgi:hypothetical protein
MKRHKLIDQHSKRKAIDLKTGNVLLKGLDLQATYPTYIVLYPENKLLEELYKG